MRLRRADRVGLLALLAFRDEMRFLPGWFAANAHQVDGVIAFDDGSSDGSAEFVADQPSVLEVVRATGRPRAGWDEPAIHRALVEAAGRHGADWLVAVDADERLEAGFAARARRAVVGLERRGIRAAAVRYHELWDGPDSYRDDGPWGDRWRSRLFAWRPDHVVDPRPLHGHWAPLNSRRRGGFVPVDLRMYHLRMIARDDRLLRRSRYESIDPNHDHQPQGYAYLTDESGCVLRPVPAGRGYAPLHRDPPLAVVVISVGNPPELPGAVASLTAQVPRPEVVVVNTGGGGARASVAPLGVAVVETADVRNVGSARNLGIAATRAPIVAFLAADCRAEPGWVAERMAHHGAGSRAVASAITNPHPRSAAAWASYLIRFGSRMPSLPPTHAQRYGASYDRSIFAEHGRFREDLQLGEDTEFHRRWTSATPIRWAPRVRTAHLNPTSVRALVVDEHARGRRGSAVVERSFGTSRYRLVAGTATSAARSLARAWRSAPPHARGRLAAAALLLPIAITAFAAGALASDGGRTPAD